MYPLLPAIPVSGLSGNAGSYRSIPVDLSDSRAREPLVRYEDYGIAIESFYARTDGGNKPYHAPIAGSLRAVWGRQTLAEKLVRVNDVLAPHDAELLVVDGYRPITCQQGLWDFFTRYAETAMPEASAEEKLEFVRTFVSDPTKFSPDDPTTWPVHVTGAAVDVMLKRKGEEKLLDLGAHFDEMSAVSATSWFETELAAGRVGETDERLQNRRLLFMAMAEEGFTNFPHEFWHYDYGDQMYALYKGKSAAWYGYVPSPEGP